MEWTNRRLVVPAVVCSLSLVGGVALTSGALFTDTENVEANTFTAGTLRLSATPATTALHAENMAPGDVVTAPLTVKNDGSLQLRYAMESTAIGPLADALTLAVKTGVNDCTTAGFAGTGTTLYSYGAIGSTQGMTVFGDKAQGPDVGDRTLNPDASETLCAQVALPGAKTGNAYQQTTADVTFRFLAEQTKNNGLTLPMPATDGGNAAAQGNLVANLAPDNTSIRLAWPRVTDKHVVSLNLYRTVDDGTTWQLVTNIADPKTTTYTDTTTAQGTGYGYALQSVGFDGTLSPLPAHPAANSTLTTSWHDPAAPSSVSVVASTSSATITWTKSASDWVTGYQVLRSPDSGQNWTSLTDTLDADATAYTDTKVTEGADYTYAVVALGKGSTSSAKATAASSVPYTAPATPTGVAAGAITPSAVTVKWTASTGPNLTGYRVLRSSNHGDSWATLSEDLAVSATSFTDSTVKEGAAYDYTVVALGKGSTASGRAASLSVSVPYTAPAAPVTVTSTSATPTAVALTWTASTGPNLTGYTVYRSIDGATWKNLGSVAADTTSYTDTTVSEGATYVYAVQATGAGATSSTKTPSSPVSVPFTPPVAPASLSVTAVTPTQVALSWPASAGPNLTGYKVYRSADGGSTWDALDTLGSAITTYTDTKVTEGAVYTYAIQALGAGSTTSAKTNTTSVSVPFAPPAAPGAVSTTNVSPTSVTVNWTASGGPNLTGYKVYRSTNGGSTWEALTTLGATATSYVDNAVTQGATYLYSVIATGTGNGNTTSTRVTATSVNVPYQAPAAPTDVSTNNVTPTQVVVSWTASTGPNLTGYTVFRSADGGSTWTTLGSTGIGATSYTDSGVTQGAAYTYAVQATGSGGTTSAKATAASVGVPYQAPAAPTGVTTSNVTPTSVTVNWAASAGPNLTGYKVFRSTDGGSTWATLTTLGTSATSYTDATVTEGATYTYAVQATGSGSTTSARINAASVGVPYTPPAAVTTVTTASATPTSVALNWTASAGPNLTGYTVFRSTDAGKTWTTLGTVGTGTTTYTDDAVTQGATYTYAVQATGSGSTSSVKTAAAAITVPYQAPAAPAGVATSNVTPTSVTVNWPASAGPNLTGYTVYRSSASGANQITLTTLGADTTSYTDTTVAQGGAYVYMVQATGSGSTSSAKAYSASVSVPWTPPAAVSSVTTSNVAARSVTVTWAASTGPNLTGYTLYRSTDGGATWSTLSTVGTGSTSYTDTSVVSGKDYTYSVIATGTGSTASARTSATKVTTPTLAAPTNLTGVAPAATTTTAKYTWNAVAGATAYNVYLRSCTETVADENNSQTCTATDPVYVGQVSTNSYSLDEGKKATRYFAQITAVGGTGGVEGARTGIVTTDTIASFPTFLSINPVIGDFFGQYENVTVKFGGLSSSMTLQRRTDGGTWQTMSTMPCAYGGGVAFNCFSKAEQGWTPPTTGHTYEYRVQGCNAAGCTGWSNPSAGTRVSYAYGVNWDRSASRYGLHSGSFMDWTTQGDDYSFINATGTLAYRQCPAFRSCTSANKSVLLSTNGAIWSNNVYHTAPVNYEARTWEFFYKQTGTWRASAGLMGQGTTTNATGWGLRTGTTSTTLQWVDGTVIGNSKVADGNWHLYDITYDGTTVRVYEDAVLLGSFNKLVLSGTTVSESYTAIGQIATTTTSALGYYDDWLIYKAALPASVIAEHWAGRADD